METLTPHRFRFGEFELDTDAAELRRNGERVRVQPQPFKLMVFLVRRAGHLVTREEIRRELWTNDTYVDFEQAVNFCVSQIRDVLKDQADRPLYIQTVPKRGYRFIAPVDAGEPRKGSSPDGTTVRLQKALWTNIAELRLAEERRRSRIRIAGIAVLAIVLVSAVTLLIWRWLG